jgi:hypothetical protein
MSANPASNFANLASLTPAFLSHVDLSGNIVQNVLQTFLSGPNQINYERMVITVQSAQTALATGTNSTLRSLVAAADGRVAYDSTKTNTWALYNPSSSTDPAALPGVGSFIGENHNTRPEIMLAVLNNTGVGLSNRFSSTSNTSQKYQATRLGDSTNDNLGTLRLSLTNTI